MPDRSSSDISQAVYQTLLYSDIFDFPLTVHEVHRYLPAISATVDEVFQALSDDPRFMKQGKYHTLTGRQEIVSIREQREARSKELMPHALRYGHRLGRLPFVRMVALTGSLAVMNVSENADFDYMLVTYPGRLWTARAFALLLNRLTRRLGHTLCPNLIISDGALEWHQHDLYSAHELCQMIPISGMEVYQRLMTANQWIMDFLPNASLVSISEPPMNTRKPISWFQRVLESLLHGGPGDRFEHWEMDRKIARFSAQEGFGEETVFSATMCQGNFDHHRKWTHEKLRQRINSFNMDAPITVDG